MFDFCSEKSGQAQDISEGVSVRPFYLLSTCLAILEMKPGSYLPEHKHLHEQISYILEGEVEVTIKANSKLLRPGDLYSVRSNTSHSCRALGQSVKIIIASSPLLQDYVFGEE